MTVARSQPADFSRPLATTPLENQGVGAVHKERLWYESPWLVGVFVTAIGTIIAVWVLSQQSASDDKREASLRCLGERRR
jgi:hypothetical protein